MAENDERRERKKESTWTAPGPAPRLIPRSSAGRQPVARTIQTMPDGTRVEYRSDGTPVRQWNPDGSVVTYDDQGRPSKRRTPTGALTTDDPAIQAAVRAVAQLAQLAVRPTQPSTSPDRPARTPLVEDGGEQEIAFDSFDSRGRPLTGVRRDGVRLRYEYGPDGDVLIRYSTGLLRAAEGLDNRGWEKLSDGTRYTSFDEAGRPIAGVDGSERPFRLSYGPDGHATVHPAGTDPSTADTDRRPGEHRDDGEGRDDRKNQDTNTPRLPPMPSFGHDGLDDGSHLARLGSTPGFGPDQVQRLGPDDPQQLTALGDDRDRRDNRAVNPGPPGPAMGGSGLGAATPGMGMGLGSRTAFNPPPTVTTASNDPGLNTIATGDGPTLKAPGPSPVDTLPQGRSGISLADGPATTNSLPPAGGPRILPTIALDPGGTQALAPAASANGFGTALAGVAPSDVAFGAPDTSTVDASGVGPNQILTQTLTDTAPDPTSSDGLSNTVDQVATNQTNIDQGSVVQVEGNGQTIQEHTPQQPQTAPFSIDLGALSDAINQISGHRDAITSDVTSLTTSFATIESAWQSPAGMSAHTLFDVFKKATDNFVTILDEAINRMNAAYNNYVDTENTNVSNFGT